MKYLAHPFNVHNNPEDMLCYFSYSTDNKTEALDEQRV